MEWSQRKTLALIEQYRLKPLLWDQQDAHYFNKRRKHDAWAQLALDMGSTEEECRRKIVSLRASMRREKARTVRSRSAGKGPEDSYSSTWFAYKKLLFVQDGVVPLEDSLMDTAAASLSNTSPVKRKVIPPSSRERWVSSTMDECESFSLFVKNKLANYSTHTRNYAQHLISNILFSADQGEYERVHPQAPCPTGKQLLNPTSPSPSDQSHESEEYLEIFPD